MWKSSNIAVAAVTAAGVVTAAASGKPIISATSGGKTGSAAVSVRTSLRPAGGDPFFSDDFETGDRSHTENGVIWKQGSGTHVRVSNEIAHSGSHALRFEFVGGPSGTDASAEQRYNLGRNITEVWVEFYIYYPDGTEGVGARYSHRDDVRSDNNKFFRIWGDDYNGSNKIGASTLPAKGGPDSSLEFEYRHNERSMGPWGSGGFNFVNDAARGTWTQVRFHGKLASGPETRDGVMDIWFNGVRHSAKNKDTGGYGLDTYSSKNNYWNQGYFLGWANSGFDQTTYIFIDDVKFYEKDPGW